MQNLLRMSLTLMMCSAWSSLCRPPWLMMAGVVCTSKMITCPDAVLTCAIIINTFITIIITIFLIISIFMVMTLT